jgi:hypothetical protein
MSNSWSRKGRLHPQRMAASAGGQVEQPRRLATSAPDSLKPTRPELAILLISLMFGLTVYLVAPDSPVLANIVLPISLMVAMVYGNYIMATRRVATLLTPIFAFRTAIIFYGGVGALVPIFANDIEMTSLLTFYFFDEKDMLKYNIVNILFCLIFVSAGPMISRLLKNVDSNSDSFLKNFIHKSSLSIIFIGILLFLFGAIVNLIFILPFQFGFITSTFPVALYQISNSAQIGIFLMIIWALKGRSIFLYPIFGVGIIYVIIGLLTFSKTDAILPLIMMVAALVYSRPNLKTLALGALLIVSVYQALQPVTAYGRHRILQTYGEITAPAGLNERLRIVRDFYVAPTEEYETDVNYALLRFSYVNVGTLVIGRYDIGQPGNSYQYAYALLIPRAIWPDKPILTEASRNLNYEATGSDRSSVSSGLATEGYWNGGWLGVALAALITSVIFWLWSLYALRVQEVGAWHLFPVILVGIRAGTRFDGWLVVDVLGPVMLALVGHFILTFANRLISRARGG